MSDQSLSTDLFGNPVAAPDGDTAGRNTAEPGASPRDAVNDMDLAQTVLADIADDKSAPLHVDDNGQVRRCTRRDTEPVTDDVAVVVEQLIATHYLTTRKRSGPGHGLQITTTRTGRNALFRWRAYCRPSTWGPAPNPDAG